MTRNIQIATTFFLNILIGLVIANAFLLIGRLIHSENLFSYPEEILVFLFLLAVSLSMIRIAHSYLILNEIPSYIQFINKVDEEGGATKYNLLGFVSHLVVPIIGFMLVSTILVDINISENGKIINVISNVDDKIITLGISLLASPIIVDLPIFHRLRQYTGFDDIKSLFRNWLLFDAAGLLFFAGFFINRYDKEKFMLYFSLILVLIILIDYGLNRKFYFSR